MADQLANVIVPNLQFERPVDQKGLLAVATYGTGKTHLMSMIAAVAEHAELATDVTHPAVRESTAPSPASSTSSDPRSAQPGCRCATSSARSSSRASRAWVSSSAFRRLDEVTNTKDALSQMMEQFEQAHPERGLLLVLDELLDYLRGRRDAELISGSLIPTRNRGDLPLDSVPFPRRCAGGDLRQSALPWSRGRCQASARSL